MAERHIGYLIKQINERIKQCADRDMECCGVTFAQGRIIGFLGSIAAEKLRRRKLRSSWGYRTRR